MRFTLRTMFLAVFLLGLLLWFLMPVARIDAVTCARIRPGMTQQEAEVIVGAPQGWYDGVDGWTGGAPELHIKGYRPAWVGLGGELVLELDDTHHVAKAELYPIQITSWWPTSFFWERFTRVKFMHPSVLTRVALHLTFSAIAIFVLGIGLIRFDLKNRVAMYGVLGLVIGGILGVALFSDGIFERGFLEDLGLFALTLLGPAFGALVGIAIGWAVGPFAISAQTNDLAALQGLWRVHSSVTGGEPVGEAATHYLITGSAMKEIVPNFVDDGTLRTTFELDESISPKRLTQTLDYNGPNGPPDPEPIIIRFLYRLQGDTLTLCCGDEETFPRRIAKKHSILTLVRDHGPIPESRQPSGTPSIVDETLGTLQWDDNLHWYGGRVSIGATTFSVSLKPSAGTDISAALSRLKQVAADFDRYRQLAAEYATRGLLDIKNDNWLNDDETPVSASEFKARMTLTSIHVEPDGDLEFWHRDGNLFWGHSIQVCVDCNDKCTRTDIPG